MPRTRMIAGFSAVTRNFLKSCDTCDVRLFEFYYSCDGDAGRKSIEIFGFFLLFGLTVDGRYVIIDPR